MTTDEICVITLHRNVTEKDFEQFMRREIFPAVQVLRRNVSGAEHILLKNDAKVGGQSQYVWRIAAELVGGGTQDVSVNSVAVAALKQIDHFGTVSTFKRLDEAQSSTA